MRKNVNDWERVVSVAAGAGMVLAAARRATGSRTAGGVTGAVLIARGLSGYCPVNAAIGRGRLRDDPRRAVAGSRGVFVRESVTIQAPPDVLFTFWRDPTNLPQVMPFLERVDRIDEQTSRWVVRGPAGLKVQWDARVINEVPFETIGWESLPGADVASAGSVRFRPVARGGTQLTVTLQYAPPAGRLGASAAWLLGRSAGREVRQALRTFKQTVEAGESPTTDGQPAGRRTRLFRMTGATA